jgi:hypothetical protein
VLTELAVRRSSEIELPIKFRAYVGRASEDAAARAAAAMMMVDVLTMTKDYRVGDRERNLWVFVEGWSPGNQYRRLDGGGELS